MRKLSILFAFLFTSSTVVAQERCGVWVLVNSDTTQWRKATYNDMPLRGKTISFFDMPNGPVTLEIKGSEYLPCESNPSAEFPQYKLINDALYIRHIRTNYKYVEIENTN